MHNGLLGLFTHLTIDLIWRREINFRSLRSFEAPHRFE